MYTPTVAELMISRPRPGTVVVKVYGEHDHATRDETAALLARLISESDLLIVDITETKFIDSSFLTNLKNTQRAAEVLGHTVLLQVGTEPIVKRMLEISNFLTHFDHVSSREEALAWAPE
jgi:anti-anti-sigma factor